VKKFFARGQWRTRRYQAPTVQAAVSELRKFVDDRRVEITALARDGSLDAASAGDWDAEIEALVAADVKATRTARYHDDPGVTPKQRLLDQADKLESLAKVLEERLNGLTTRAAALEQDHRLFHGAWREAQGMASRGTDAAGGNDR
jgi:hypothetical protein